MNTKHTILIVEDESAIREMVRLTLTRANYKVLDCESVTEAQELLKHHQVHLILLDWMLPGMSGVDFAQALKADEQHQTIPIILLTAKAEEEDKLEGFSVGIDDYICKPFSLKEMQARIQSVLRRSDQHNKEIITLSGLTIEKDNHLVYTEDKEEVHLGPTEFKILHLLMSTPGRVYSREQLLDLVWGIGVYVDERTVDVHIRRLRKALTPYDKSDCIRTIRGSGYSFKKS